MNLLVARSLIGYQDHLDRGPSLSYLPSSCYDEPPLRRKEDKVELPTRTETARRPVQTKATQQDSEAERDNTPSRLRLIAEKIKKVESKLFEDFLKGQQKS